MNVGNLLGDLSRMRAECDYQLNMPLRFQNRSVSIDQMLSMAVQTAEDLWNALEEYSPGDSPDGCPCPISN